MTEKKDDRIFMRADPTFIQKVDSWRSKQPGLPSRSEAIRRLVEAGLLATDPEDTTQRDFQNALIKRNHYMNARFVIVRSMLESDRDVRRELADNLEEIDDLLYEIEEKLIELATRLHINLYPIAKYTKTGS